MYCDKCALAGSLAVMAVCNNCGVATSSNQSLCTNCSKALMQCEYCRAHMRKVDTTRPIENDDELSLAEAERDRLVQGEKVDWEAAEKLQELIERYKAHSSISGKTTMKNTTVSGEFSQDPIGAVKHYYQSTENSASQRPVDEAYLKAVKEFEADFNELATGSAKLNALWRDQLRLVTTRSDGTLVEYNIDIAKGTVAVAWSPGDRLVTYTIDCNKRIVKEREESRPVVPIEPMVLEKLDAALRVPLLRSQAPNLFRLLGQAIPSSVDQVEVATTVSAFDELKRDCLENPNSSSPFIAQVFFCGVGASSPLGSLEIIRVDKDGWVDLKGKSSTLCLFPRSYLECGLASTELKDPQAAIRKHGYNPAMFNGALQELVRLQKAHPTHSGLAQVTHYLPKIQKTDKVVIPC